MFEALLPIIKRDKWSIFHPINDIEQLKSALQEAAVSAGINWSTIAEDAIEAGISVGKNCFSFDAMDSYFETVKKNPKHSAEMHAAITNTVVQTAKKQGHNITAEDLVNNAKAKGYANVNSLECENIAWTAICSH